MHYTSPPLVSLIIRTKNEEKWIPSCLRSVFQQDYKNIEVIIVDNGSTDLTLKRTEEYPVKTVHISEFFPGKAINEGIRASNGDVIVCLSGHCVPVHNTWLTNLIHDLSDSQVAGVYGRQEPLSYSSDFDKRDLITVFGLDKKIQSKDSFFHNANSAFRREIWERFPFDEQVTNIEDRVWGQQVIAAGLKIVYEPDARVYHWHGIHHDLNPERARKIVRILENLEGLVSQSNCHVPEELNIVTVIPVRGQSIRINDTTLLEYAIRAAKESHLSKHVIVATDDAETAEYAAQLGALVPFIRPDELSHDFVDTVEVLRYTLDQIEPVLGVPDLVVALEETYPFRTPTILDDMIHRIIADGFDTVIAAKTESRGILLELDGKIELFAEGFMPTQFKQTRAMIGLMGLAFVTHPMFIRMGNLLGNRLGVFEVYDPIKSVQVRDASSIALAEKILEDWWHKQRSCINSERAK